MSESTTGCIPKDVPINSREWYQLRATSPETCVWTEETMEPIVTDDDEVICLDNV